MEKLIAERIEENKKTLELKIGGMTCAACAKAVERVNRILNAYGDNSDVIVVSNHINAGGGEFSYHYEEMIAEAGGVDLFMGGIGPDGHLAFNEPGSSLSSRTRIKTLTTDTIHANSRFFDNDLSLVPKQALTVGIGTVMDAKEVLLVCSGHNKARALKHCIDGDISHKWTSSMLQMHPHAIVVCDEASCDELTVGTYKYYLDKERGNL